MKKKVIPPASDEAPKLEIVAGYARVSTEKDAMLHSLAAQVSYYSALIQGTPGWIYGGVYADEAKTGTKEDRPAFQRLIADCRAGKVHRILTKSVSRFARNTLTLLETVRELKALGIDIYFEEERIHTLSKEGELLLTILASYAQEESRAVSENMRWRIQKKFEKGIPTHNGILGYRLVEGIYQIVPEEADVVRMIFDSYQRGMGSEGIAEMLNTLGIVTRFGRPWCKSTVYGILRNEKYTGTLILQKTYTLDHISKIRRINRGERAKYTVPDAHGAIIPREMFDRAQVEIARRREYYRPPDSAPRKAYPFSSLMQCAACGKNYRRKLTGVGKYKRPVWICQTFNTRGRKACASRQIPEDILIEKTKTLLGVEAIDIHTVREKVKRIMAQGHGRLTFFFHDGQTADVQWENRSRRESWGEEQRSQAREHALKRRASR